MIGVKDVALTEPKPEKQKRRSALAGVKELAARLESARLIQSQAQSEFDRASDALEATTRNFKILAEAYYLVKPQPRTRRKA